MGTQGFDQRAQARAQSLIGQVVDGRYQIDRILAMGGMGSVYLARHLKLKKRVALKVLHPGTEDHPELYLRFEREALAGAQVTHAHVAAATDFGELEDGTRYLVLEYVRGKTLRAVLDGEAPLSAVRAGKVARQIAVALGEIHARGIVHRDLKPRNVMLAEGDFVKVVDFGLARIDSGRISTVSSDEVQDDERLTAGGMIFGTIEYLAPEAAFGMDLVDSRADLYALGVMFYEMLTGLHPFEAHTEAELFAKQRLKPPPPFVERAPAVSVDSALEAVVMKLLDKDPDERFQTASELIETLDQTLPEARIAPREPAPPASEALGRTGDFGPVRSSFPPPLPAAPASVPPLPAAPASVPPEPAPTTTRSPSVRPAEPASAPPDSPETRSRRVSEPSARPKSGGPSSLLLVAGGVALALGAYALTRPPSSEPEPANGASPATTTSEVAPAPPLAESSLPTPSPSSSSSVSSAPSTSASASPSGGTPAVDAPPAAADLDAIRSAIKANKLDAAADAALSLLTKSRAVLDDKAGFRVVRKLLVVLAQDKHQRAAELYRAVGTLQGPRGPDLLYDLLEGSGRASWADRATDTLKDEQVIALASPAVRIAFALRTAPCEEKLGLVDRAVSEGDARALVAMQIVVRGCVRDTRRVDGAIRRLKDRLLSAQ